jgi:predicted nucleotidyltransferase
LNSRQFFDWQTLGGGNDVSKLVEVLNRSGATWCMIGGLAVNHWSAEPMATADVDIVISAKDVDSCVVALEEVGFKAERFAWSVNLSGSSKVTIQISTDKFYESFPDRAIDAEVHGIAMRVASVEDTLAGKAAAYQDPKRRGSKRQKDLLDLVRLIESHPQLLQSLPDSIRPVVEASLEN